ncbi:thermonuclease family protein [Rossellomorea vietnamensis]|uniref:thermonuclease family protein n=1 Tax=Rossellomorea vietnamensis TaxID=218284 RepID=UPI003CEDD1B4
MTTKFQRTTSLMLVFALVLSFFSVPAKQTYAATSASELTSAETLTVSEALAQPHGQEVTLKGYVVTDYYGENSIKISDSIGDTTNTIVVKLESEMKPEFSPVNNPDSLNKEITVTGKRGTYYSQEAVKEVSMMEFTEDSSSAEPTDPSESLSIADAKLKIGQTVTTEGIVTADNSSIGGGKLSTYIQDETGGINLFAFDPSKHPDVKEGDKVKVTGEITVYKQLTEIVAETVEIISSGSELPDAESLTLEDMMNPAAAEPFEGQLVTVNGYVKNIPDSPAGGGYNISLVDEDFNSTTLRVLEGSMDISAIEEGKWYDITGILSQYDGYQLIPRNASDLTEAAEQPEAPTAAGDYTSTVHSVTDGDTIRLSTPVLGADRVRFVNIDTPETNMGDNSEVDGDNQDYHGEIASAHLKTLLQPGDQVTLKLGEEPTDNYGRLLAQVINKDGINTNLEMVKQGYAVTYFIWPIGDETEYETFQAAVKEAKDNERGIWNPADLLTELPFEYRVLLDGREYDKPVGNSDTKEYVTPVQWEQVPVEKRVFFWDEETAETQGYTLAEGTTAPPEPEPEPDPTEPEQPTDPVNGTLTVSEALAQPQGTEVTMKGYIVGESNGQYAVKVSDSSDDTSTSIVVKLETDMRAEFSPANNPDALNKQILVTGERDAYSGNESIEYVTSIEFIAEEAPSEPAVDHLTVSEALAQPQGTEVTMQGYIVGESNGQYAVKVSDSTDNTSSTIVVKLETDMRAEFSPLNNPDALNKQILVTGERDVYSGNESIEYVTSIEFIAEEAPSEPAVDYLTVSEALAQPQGTDVTMQGYIVGESNGQYAVKVSDSIDNTSSTIVVKLETDMRAEFSPANNPDALNKQITVTGTRDVYSGSESIESVSNIAFTESEAPSQPETHAETLSIADAKLKMGQTVTIEGIVTADNEAIGGGKLSTYLQDDTAGINLFGFDLSQYPNVKEGDKVKVTGEITSYKQLTEIIPGTVEVISSGNDLPAAKTISLGDLTDPATAEPFEGQLVKVNGYLKSIPSTPAGGGYNITLLDEDYNGTTLRVIEGSIDVTELQEGKWYDITAILSQYDSYQLIPRKASDLTEAAEQPEAPTAAGEYTSTVHSVTDGDTIRLSTPVLGADRVRFVNIDTPETNMGDNAEVDGDNQDYHGEIASAHLKTLLQPGDQVTLKLGEEATDNYGRLLAQVINKDGINTNLEMVKQGHAVTYFIWPVGDETDYEKFQAAVKDAKDNERGIWNPADPLKELPFEYRALLEGGDFNKPVGNSDTKKYVEPTQWEQVPVEKRIFFWDEETAIAQGYTMKTEDSPEEVTAKQIEALMEKLVSGDKTKSKEVAQEFINLVEEGTLTNTDVVELIGEELNEAAGNDLRTKLTVKRVLFQIDNILDRVEKDYHNPKVESIINYGAERQLIRIIERDVHDILEDGKKKKHFSFLGGIFGW